MKTSLVALTLLAITAVTVKGGFDDADELRRIRTEDRGKRIAQLKGLSEIRLLVVVWLKDRENETARLRTQIELKLRALGLRLSEHLDRSDIPMLICGISGDTHDGRLYRNVSVRLVEEATIVRNRRIVKHDSWNSTLLHGMRVVDAIDLPGSTKELLIGVDDFCNEFLTANPPKKP